MSPIKPRNQYFDFLRGVAIIMVIGIHTVPTITHVNTLHDLLIISIRNLLNCAVPIFLAISGYFIAKKDLSSTQNVFDFWKKQIAGVYVPCLVWSLGWFCLHWLTSGTSDILVHLVLLISCGYSVYYFIALIIQLYLLAPFLIRNNNWIGIMASAVVSGTAIMLVSYMLHIEGKSFPLLIYAGPFFLWIIFFMMGIWYSKHNRSYNLIPAWIMTVLGYLCSILESIHYLSLNGNGVGIKLSSFIYSAGIIMILFSLNTEKRYRENRFTRQILYIGEVSFGIYFIHMYVYTILQQLTGTTDWIIGWSVTLIISCLCIAITKKFLPAKFSKKYLGFR